MKKFRYLLLLTLCAALALVLVPQALASEVPVIGVNLSPSSLTLVINGSESLSASVVPGETTQTGVVFSSSDPSIATVDMYGNVKGVKPGYCIIYATSASNPSLWKSCAVTVLTPTTIKMDVSRLSLKIGHTATINAQITPEQMSAQGTSFRSSNPNVAVVSNTGSSFATVTGVSQGTATIYCSTADGTMATVEVTVGIPITAIKLSKTSFTINTGSQTTLTATLEPANATSTALNWTSSNTNVATVDNYGNITTWCTGYAIITATAADGSGVSAKCDISVVGVNVTHVPTPKPTPTPTPTLAPGSTYTPPPNGVTAYVNFTLLEKGTTWCKVWYKGTTGYVMTAYVRFDKALPTLRPGTTPTPTVEVTKAPGSPSGTIAFVNTVKGGLNLRAAAATGAKVLRRIPEKAAFTVITYGANWCYAWYNGTSGYVMTKFVRMGNVTPTPKGVTATPKPATAVSPTPQPLSGSRALVTTANGSSVNLRSAASITSTRVRLIPSGATVDILAYGKEWCKASYKGSTGYIMTKFLFLGTGVKTN